MRVTESLLSLLYTQAEFDAALQSAMMPIMGLMMMGQQGMMGGGK